jgi:hypothetical protein
MEAFSPPRPAIDLSTHLYYQLVYTLTDLLPPPLDDTPASLRTRNQAAIAKVAALLPVNANEIDLTPSFACSVAQCIAARARAEDLLRLLRQNADDIGLVMRLNAQYESMVRNSPSVHGRLMRVQALRQKREAIDGPANQDAWSQHIAERSMLWVADPDARPLEAARETLPGAAPVEAPAACVDQRIEENVSYYEMNSQDVAFETRMSAILPGRGPGRPDSSRLHEAVRAAMPETRLTSSPLAGRDLLANGRESHGRAG